MKEKKTVLFICTHNSARSQMAEAMTNAFYGDRFIAFSAGIHPSAINPHAVKVMGELDIDISSQRSKGLDTYAGKKFDYAVALCDAAKEACVSFPDAKKHLYAGFDNPSDFSGSEKQILAGFRRVRDELREWIRDNLACSG